MLLGYDQRFLVLLCLPDGPLMLDALPNAQWPRLLG